MKRMSKILSIAFLSATCLFTTPLLADSPSSKDDESILKDEESKVLCPNPAPSGPVFFKQGFLLLFIYYDEFEHKVHEIYYLNDKEFVIDVVSSFQDDNKTLINRCVQDMGYVMPIPPEIKSLEDQAQDDLKNNTKEHNPLSQ